MIRYGSVITGLRRAKSRRILFISRWICGNAAKRMNSVVAFSVTPPLRVMANSYRRFDGSAAIGNNFGRKHSAMRCLWRSEMVWRMDEIRFAAPFMPVARLPQPAISAHEYPVAIAIRHPAPRIGGYPDVSIGRGQSPVTVGKRVPAQIHAIGTPAVTIARQVIVLAVVIKIADAILIRGLLRRQGVAGIGLQILVTLAAPLVEIVLLNTTFQIITARIIRIEREAFARSNSGFLVFIRRADGYFALPYSQVQRTRI